MVAKKKNKQASEGNGKSGKLGAVYGGLLLISILWVIGGFFAWHNLQTLRERAVEDLSILGEQMGNHTASAVKHLDLALKRTAEKLASDDLFAKQADYDAISQITLPFLGIANLQYILLLDKDGHEFFRLQLDYANTKMTAPDRNVREQLSQNPHRLQINRINDYSLGFSRPIHDHRGELTGFIAALVSPHYFDAVYTAQKRQADIRVQITSRLQDILANDQGPAQDGRFFYMDGLESLAFLNLKDNRAVASVPLDDYELRLIVSKTLAGLDADWQEQLISLAIIWAFFSLLILIFATHSKRTFETLIQEATIRAKVEADLRILSRAVEQSPDMILITDVDTRIQYINPTMEKNTGYTLEEVRGLNPKVFSAQRDDMTDYEKMWDLLNEGHVWHGQFLNKKKDGTLYWEQASISPIKNEHGQTTHYLAIKEDITKRKSADDQLKLTAAVFDAASEAIMVCDAKQHIESVNKSFTEITGYDFNEVVGQRPAVLKSGRHGPDFYALMQQRLLTHGKWEGEIWNRRKNGEIYPQWLSIKTVRDENGEIIRYISLFTDITNRKKNEEKILYQANYDALTGLPNRTLFMDRLNRALLRAERTKSSVALLFIDLDRFKHVNDTLGHASGDMLLKQAAERLNAVVRKTDTVARLGGDEFTVILQDLNDYHIVEVLVEKLLTDLSAPYDLDSNVAFVSASIGITIFPDDGGNLEELLKNADTAMYQAKENGRNLSQFFTREMNDEALERRDLENALHQALDREEFVLHYQPIVDAQSGNLISCEVLLRWHHPDHGNVMPGKFIPLAEDTGLILPIGEWVLMKACHEAVNWARHNKTPPNVSVNMSSRQFKRSDAADLVEKALNQTGLPAHRLTIEITESLLIEDDDKIIEQLNRIRALGVGLSIDDFGTGYSSLSYLRRFPISTLKIDRAFIMDLSKESEADALVSAILSMAHSLKLKVVAEGVEELTQLNILKEGGCDYIQGYYYSPPVPVEAFRIMAKQNEPLNPDE